MHRTGWSILAVVLVVTQASAGLAMDAREPLDGGQASDAVDGGPPMESTPRPAAPAPHAPSPARAATDPVQAPGRHSVPGPAADQASGRASISGHGETLEGADLAELAARQSALLRTGQPIVPEWTYDAVHLSWPLGDVDADGFDDVLWETYCVDADGCSDSGVPVANIPLQEVCYDHRHHIQTLAGSSGDTLWQRHLDQAHPEYPFVPVAGGVGGCVVDAVIATVPDGSTQDILLYSWKGVMASRNVVAIEHTLQRLDGSTGATEWTWSTQGSFVAGPAVVADTLFLVPFVQAPPRQGLPLLGDMDANLLVRGIGFAAASAGTAEAYASTYEPDEWAAAVALDDGTETWRTDTFGGEPGRNVYPITFHPRPPFVPPLQGDGALIVHLISYFAGFGCCFDLTGDGIPDLLYATLEEPQVHPEQPPDTMQGRGARLRVYDGADGSVAWDMTVEDDSPDLCTLAVMPLGDVDGDGAHDFRLSVTYGEAGLGCPPGPVHTETTVRGGPDHAVLWSHDTRDAEESIALAPLGDIDGDGGNDLMRILVPNTEPGQAGLTEFQNISVGAVRGASGELLWQRESFAAALDLAIGTAMMFLNGLPDFDGDGVGDVWLDRIESLEDQTAVHHLTLVSGADGRTLTEVPTVGAFAVPLGTRDLDADGQDDFIVVQGDLDDIWMTAYDGHEGEAQWSRRIMSMNTTNALLAIPLLRVHSLELAPDGAWDALVGLTFFTLDLGGARGPLFAFTQQHLFLHGAQGSLLWGIPAVGDGDASLARFEPTPAVQAYEEYRQEKEATSGSGVTTADVPAWVVPLAFGGAALAAAAAVVGLVRRGGRA